MSDGSMRLSPFGSNCCAYLNPPKSVAVVVSGLVTVTLHVPAACAAVVAVIVVLLTRTTPVAAVPPMLTVAPLRKPLPVIVIGVPPPIEPVDGTTLVTLTGEGTAVTATFADFVSEQPPLFVTVTFNVRVPAAPAVKVTKFVPLPFVMVPPLMLQAYVAPAPAFATDA